MSWLRKRWWLIPVALPVLIYAGLIIAAYIFPPLRVNSISTAAMPQPAAVVEVQNHSWWPVTLTRATVEGVLPPDEMSAMVVTGGHLAQVVPPDAPMERGALAGWRVGPQERAVSHGVSMVWYQNADLRWLDCPIVHYRYLGWPLATPQWNFCSEHLRGPAMHAGTLNEATGEWGPWQSAEGGLRFRTQRVTQDRGDELFIQVAEDEGVPQVYIGLDEFREEPAGGRARFRMRFTTFADMSGTGIRTFSIPLRWGEPTPEVQLEVIPDTERR